MAKQDDVLTDEIRNLAQHALVSDFWKEFSGLVNKYVAASAGLDEGGATFADQLQEKTSVFGRDDQAESDHHLNIYGSYDNAGNSTCGFDTLKEALLEDQMVNIWVGGTKVFTRQPNSVQWMLA